MAIVITFCSCAQNSRKAISLGRISPPPSKGEFSYPAEDGGKVFGKYQPINFDIQKAVWISYLDLGEMLEGHSEDTFKDRFSVACENISALGCNTVYVHVRAFGDAYYDSELFPWADAVSHGGEPDFDPLEIMVDIAHENGLSFHAWINPLRCDSAEKLEKAAGYPIGKWLSRPQEYPEYLVYVPATNRHSLDPAVEEVRELIGQGAAEIVQKYEVDGIHLDDYFYPTDSEDFDSLTYAAAQTQLSLKDWRLENCSLMVRNIYDSVKEINTQVQVGISPQGNIENNYSKMYADVKRWCAQEGYADYIAPQLYYGYGDPVKPFESTLDEWLSLDYADSVSLIVGLAPYKALQEEEFINDTGIIARQIRDCLEKDNCKGVALYNYINLFAPDSPRMEQERKLICEKLSQGEQT